MTLRGKSPRRGGCKEQDGSSESGRGEQALGHREDQSLNNGGRRSATATRRSNIGFHRLRDIEVVGDKVRGKKDGIFRVWYENFDGLPIVSIFP